MAEQISDAKIKATEKEHSESFDSIFVNDGDKVRQVTKEKARELMGVTGAETAIDKLNTDLASAVSEIQKNTEADAETKRKLDFMWKLNQGISYQYETDANSAYQKDIPSGAKAACVNKIGGKTVAWNQLISQSESTYTNNGITFKRNNDGSITINGTATDKAYYQFTSIKSVVGHKYLVKGGISTSVYVNSFIGINCIDSGNGIIAKSTSEENNWVRLTIESGTVCENIKVIPQIFDLTQMFGSGNEPSTVAEFESMFPADYYPYDAGTLMSAQVNEVVEQGKNLIDLTNVVSFTGGINYKCIPNKLKNNTKYTFSVINQNNYTGKFALYTDTNGESSLSTGTGVLISVAYVAIGSSRTFITPENVEDFPYLALCGNDATCGVQYFDEYDFQLEKGESATPYSPYHKTAYQIPQAITQLDGYGIGITDDVCNYVDFETKTYHQLVGSVDLGTLGWTRYDSENVRFQTERFNIKPVEKGLTPNIICASYSCVTGSYFDDNKTVDKTIRVDNSGNYIYLRNLSYTDVNSLKSALSGVMLYYELAEEVVTDISDIIGYTFQNPLEVEACGTLTFKNSNGDDYRIPVPNEEEYLIALAEVTA